MRWSARSASSTAPCLCSAPSAASRARRSPSTARWPGASGRCPACMGGGCFRHSGLLLRLAAACGEPSSSRCCPLPRCRQVQRAQHCLYQQVRSPRGQPVPRHCPAPVRCRVCSYSFTVFCFRFQLCLLAFVRGLCGAHDVVRPDMASFLLHRQKLRQNAAAVQIPLGLQEDMQGVIDLVEEKAIYNTGAFGYVSPADGACLPDPTRSHPTPPANIFLVVLSLSLFWGQRSTRVQRRTREPQGEGGRDAPRAHWRPRRGTAPTCCVPFAPL